MRDNKPRQKLLGSVWVPATVFFLLIVTWAGSSVWILMTPPAKPTVKKLDPIPAASTPTKPEQSTQTARPDGDGRPLNQRANPITAIDTIAQPIIPAGPKLTIKRQKRKLRVTPDHALIENSASGPLPILKNP